MDEVDFTVLAATSVFTDLMEKCPPAEACRDAFERTAKATIKMANSTGGFGQAPNNVSGLRRKRSTSLERQRMDWSSTSGGGSSRNDGASRGHGHSQQPSLNRTTTNSATTPSSYDMLSDVFPSPSTASASLPPYRSSGGTGGIKTDPDTFSSILRSATAPTAAVNNQGLASSSNTGRGGSAVSEGPLPLSPEAVAAAAAASGQILDSSSLLAASPSQTGDTLTPRGEQNLTPQMYSAQPVATTSAGVAQQQEAGLMPFAELQGMDFLQSLQQPGRMMDGSGGGATGAGLDQLAGTGEQLDLGLGLGWEGFHHDFSDGQQVDLFDGFFFGGQQGGGGGMQGL